MNIDAIEAEIRRLIALAGGATASNTVDTQPLLQSIRDQKGSAINAAYGDLQDSTNALHALYYYGARDADLSGAQSVALDAIGSAANQLRMDEQYAKRQNDINQWTASNKLDTLFVYQQLLIILCATVILVYLMKRGLLSSTAMYMIIAILVLIFAFTVINRAQYTQSLRDKKFWNKRTFEKQDGIPVAICNS